MEISIKLIDSLCMNELFEFEVLNREFFEKTCPPRDDSYYQINNFKQILEEIIEEQEKGHLQKYCITKCINEKWI